MSIVGCSSIYDIPFDQFQRYQTASMVIEKNREDSQPLKILEIGANEHKNLEKFLPNDSVMYLDIQLSDELKKDSRYILADATNMPQIEAGSFDVVIALDVFEHIPKELRKKFIDELNRVSKDLVILAGPFDEAGVNEAEIRVNAYFKTKFGMDYVWLEEHIKNGLPELDDTLDYLQSAQSKKIIHFKHGTLKFWEKLITLHFEEVQNLDLHAFVTEIYKFYNQNIFLHDIGETCYRNFIILSEKEIETASLFHLDSRDSSQEEILQALIESTYRLSIEKRFANLQEKDRQIQEKDRQIQELQHVVQSLRIKNRIKKLFGMCK